MKALVVYFSKYGQTKKIAHRIANVLNEAGAKTIAMSVVDARRLESLAEFDRVILGCPIYAHRHSKKIYMFVMRFRQDLENKFTAFYSVSASAAGDERQQIAARNVMNDFLDSLPLLPKHRTIFAGGLPYRKYNWLLRLIMRWIVSRESGDTDTSKNYEYTDWEQVDAFSKQWLSSGAVTNVA